MRRFVFPVLAALAIFLLPFRAFATEPSEVNYDDEVVFYVDYALEEMEVIDEAYKSDGSFHQIVKDPSGVLWYYVDSVKQTGLGLVFVNGYFYYVRTAGMLVNEPGWVSEDKANGYVTAARYTFDSTTGRMVYDGPLPDNWEADWSYASITEPPLLDAGYPVTSYISYFLGTLLPSFLGFLDSLLVKGNVSFLDVCVVVILMVVVVGSILMRV